MHRRADTALELPREGREARHKNEKKRKEGRGKKTTLLSPFWRKSVTFLHIKVLWRNFRILIPGWRCNQMITLEKLFKPWMLMELDYMVFVCDPQWEIVNSWWLMVLYVLLAIKTFSVLESQQKLQLAFYCSICFFLSWVSQPWI